MTDQTKIRVRPVTWADFPTLCQLAITEALQERDGTSYLPPTLPDAYWHIAKLIGEGVGWVALSQQGSIIGVVLMRRAREEHNAQVWFLENAHLWVLSQYRSGGMVAAALMKAAETFADENAMPLLIRTTMGKNPEVLDRYMKKRGFEYLGGNHWRMPKATN